MKAKFNNCDHCFTMGGDTWCGKQLKYCNKNGWCKDHKRNVQLTHFAWLLVACVAMAILIKCIL